MSRKIKYLYWWNGKANVGDAASKPIVEWMLGYNISWYTNLTWKGEFKRFLRELIINRSLVTIKKPLLPSVKILYAVGSIIDNVGSKAVIWGSGLGRSYSRIKGKPVIWAVRGYLTLKNLPEKYDKSKIAIGDPAVLLPLIYPKERHEPKYEVGLVPHFEDYDYIKDRYGEKYKIIDVRTTDVSSFIDEILNCKYILSTAMHPIIFSQSYGIPALWIRRLEMNVGDFKFSDYFSSVGIPDYQGFINIDEILTQFDINLFFKKYHSLANVSPDRIKAIQQNLIKSFKKEY